MCLQKKDSYLKENTTNQNSKQKGVKRLLKMKRENKELVSTQTEHYKQNLHLISAPNSIATFLFRSGSAENMKNRHRQISDRNENFEFQATGETKNA